MRRRDFIAGAAGLGAAWPLAARAQQPAMPIVAFLSGGSADAFHDSAAAFGEGLSETGYVEGKNVMIDYELAQAVDRIRRLPSVRRS
jgi:putative ABC transport system substrate-binding protein